MKKPYQLNDQIKKFHQKYTSFSRANWDETSVAYGKRQRLPDGSRVDRALERGAWVMASHIIRPKLRESTTDMTDLTPEELTLCLKRAAILYGAALVGVTKLNPLWLYSHDVSGNPIEMPEGVDTVVVIAVPMDYRMIMTSPSLAASAATGNGYSRMAFTASCVAGFLAELGWRAIPSGNDLGLSIPMAIDAGLGEIGRNGLLITPNYGPRVRLCKVFTDAPLVPDHPITLGIREFCEVCRKCAQACPARSIPTGGMTFSGPTPSNNPGALKWYNNPDKCLAFWRVNGAGCSNCVRSCPFNKRDTWTHTIGQRLAGLKSRFIDKILIAIDNLLGYGKQLNPNDVYEIDS